MLFISLATMRFYSVLALLFHVGPNRFTLSSSHRCGDLKRGRFQSLGYHLTTSPVHSLSGNLVTRLTQRNFNSQYSAITSFILLRSRNILLWMCSRNDIPNMDISIPFCVITIVILIPKIYFQRKFLESHKINQTQVYLNSLSYNIN